MGRGRCALAVLLGVLVQRCVLANLPLWGLCPPLLPSLLCSLGMAAGEDRGAESGLLAGLLLWLAGASPWVLALYPLTGGLAGRFFGGTKGFWKRWLCTLPVLAGMALVQAGRGLIPGAALLPVLTTAGADALLSAACFPLAAALLRLAKLGQRKRKGGLP